MKQTQRGFTLIELLVVIAIIGILSSVILASLSTARLKSRDTRRIADIKQLQLALALFYDSNSYYPTTLAALAPTYISVVPTDPSTSNNYLYAANPVASGLCSTGTGGISYHLGAILEDSNNTYAANDSNNPGTGTFCTGYPDFAGASPSCASAGTPDKCFDVKP